MEHRDGGEQPKGQKKEESQEENDWKRKEGGGSKHHDAYAVEREQSDAEENQKSEYAKLLE
jgi:hypothetical protein